MRPLAGSACPSSFSSHSSQILGRLAAGLSSSGSLRLPPAHGPVSCHAQAPERMDGAGRRPRAADGPSPAQEGFIWRQQQEQEQAQPNRRPSSSAPPQGGPRPASADRRPGQASSSNGAGPGPSSKKAPKDKKKVLKESPALATQRKVRRAGHTAQHSWFPPLRLAQQCLCTLFCRSSRCMMGLCLYETCHLAIHMRSAPTPWDPCRAAAMGAAHCCRSQCPSAPALSSQTSMS